jgi:hypothetical protein
MEAYFRGGSRLSIDRFLHVVGDVKAGAVRASLGIVSNAADVAAYLRLAAGFLDGAA